jgi:hypothetical protein
MSVHDNRNCLAQAQGMGKHPKIENDESTHQHEMALEIYTLLMDDGYKMDDLKEVFMIY